MKTKKKIGLISICCIGIGIVLMAVGFVMGGRPGFYINKTGIHAANGNRSGASHIQEKTALEEFSSIDIDLQSADLEILPSDGYYIEYLLNGNDPEPALEVKNQTLKFKEGFTSSFIGFNFLVFDDYWETADHYYVTLYVPADKFFTSIKLNNDNGKVTMGTIRTKNMDVTDEYGQVEIESFKGDRFKADMDSGRFKIENLEADTVEIYNEYGRCELGTVKSRSLEAKLDNGNFTIGKGDIANVKIDNEDGDVTIGLSSKMEAYDFDLMTEYGSIEVPGYPVISEGDDDEKRFQSNNGAKNKVKIRCDNGDIIINEI